MVFANLFPLAWAEAEAGKFHRRVSVIMLPRGNDRLRGLPAAIGW